MYNQLCCVGRTDSDAHHLAERTQPCGGGVEGHQSTLGWTHPLLRGSQSRGSRDAAHYLPALDETRFGTEGHEHAGRLHGIQP